MDVFVDISWLEAPPFLRGDCDDSGAMNLTDALCVLDYLFARGPPPVEPRAECGLSGRPDDRELGCRESSCL